MTDKQKRAVLWCAVSTDEQAKPHKISIRDQIETGKRRAAMENWLVIDVLVVDGHSRNYIDIYQLAQDAQSKGIDAPYALIDYLQYGGFDVLWCRDGDRLGRTQSLIAYIAESVQKQGATIYTESNGYIDDKFSRLWTMTTGYQTSHFIDDLRQKIVKGQRNRLKNGLPGSGMLPRTHSYIRDPDNGKVIDIVVNEDVKTEMHNVASILLYGDRNGDYVPFTRLESVAFEMFGYGKHGKPHAYYSYYRLFWSPLTYGHVVRRSQHKHKKDLWTIETGHKIPDGCLINYDAIPPVFDADFAVTVRQALKDRRLIIGRARHKTYVYSGLLVCADCGHNLARSTAGEAIYWRCSRAFQYRDNIEKCTNNKTAREDILDNYVHQAVTIALANSDGIDNTSETTPNTLDRLQAELEQTYKQIDALISKQVNASGSLRDRYDSMLLDYGTRADKLQDEIRQAQLEHNIKLEQQNRAKHVLSQLDDNGIETYKALSQSRQNSVLRALLSNNRFAVRGGEIIGIVTE